MSDDHGHGYHDTVAPIDGFYARLWSRTLQYALITIGAVLFFHFMVIPFFMMVYGDTYSWRRHYFFETSTDILVWLYITAYPAFMIFTVDYTRLKWHINHTRDEVYHNRTKKASGHWTAKRIVAWKRRHYTTLIASLTDLLRYYTLVFGLVVPIAWVIVVLIVDFGSAAPQYYFHWVALYNRLKRVSVELLHLHTGVIVAVLVITFVVLTSLALVNVRQQLKPPAHH